MSKPTKPDNQIKSEDSPEYRREYHTADTHHDKEITAMRADFADDAIRAAAQVILREEFNAMEGPLTEPALVAEYLIATMGRAEREQFRVIYLNNRHYILGDETLFQGTLNGATVHPREVARAALMRNAAAVIVAHNHPSGIAEPSQADTLLTVKLKEALNLVEIRLLDHLIVGAGEFVSMSDRGLF